MSRAAYMREYRSRKRDGESDAVIHIDTDRLDRFISRDGRNDDSLAAAAGVNSRTIERIRKEGRAYFTTVDKLACALGIHYTEVTM